MLSFIPIINDTNSDIFFEESALYDGINILSEEDDTL